MKTKKVKQIVSALLCAAVLTNVLVGCSGGQKDAAPASSGQPAAQGEKSAGAAKAPEGARVITFWHCMGGNIGEAVEDIVNDFNNSQSEIYVQSDFQGAYDDALTKLRCLSWVQGIWWTAVSLFRRRICWRTIPLLIWMI